MPRPLVIGSDTELGNFVLGAESSRSTGSTASRALLREINGYSSSASGSSRCNCESCVSRRKAEESSVELSSSSGGNQDWGRKYLPSNGGCVYIDLDHLELCTPEVTSAYDYVAAWHAMLRVAQQAQQSVNRKATKGLRVQALVNNSDGQGNSYGGHLSFCISRRLWDNLFHRKLQMQLFLAAFQASSIVFTGQGKVGSENGQPACAFQISQRADFFETLTGLQTTYRRPLVNSRDETLCGRGHSSSYGSSYSSGYGSSSDRNRAVESAKVGDHPARLHVIFYDANLAHTSCLLKAGTMQLILAMLEAGRLDPTLILDDPLEAVVAWSHDPDLNTKARMASGNLMTAVEAQWKFFECAQAFHAERGFDGVVPRADEILALWGDTLQKLHDRDFNALGQRLDWVLKRHALSRAMARRPELTWESPEMKHLDLLYSSLDPMDGLYWAYERAGVLERTASDEQIERFVQQPPDDTRAFTRAQLMRLAGRDMTDDIDWDSMRFKVKSPRGWPSYPTLELGDPLGWTATETAPVFAAAATLEEALSALEELRNPHGDDATGSSVRALSAPEEATSSGGPRKWGWSWNGGGTN
jgi:proteasome accessory factor A